MREDCPSAHGHALVQGTSFSLPRNVSPFSRRGTRGDCPLVRGHLPCFEAGISTLAQGRWGCVVMSRSACAYPLSGRRFFLCARTRPGSWRKIYAFSPARKCARGAGLFFCARTLPARRFASPQNVRVHAKAIPLIKRPRVVSIYHLDLDLAHIGARNAASVFS